MTQRLTEGLTLAGRTARSRVLFGPHETNLGSDRALSGRHVAYYERRARGGAGILVTEVASVHADDWPYERAPLAAESAPGWRDIAAACRPHGTLVLAGLGHTGLQGSSAYSQSALWGPSRVADAVTRELPMEMERAEIDSLIAGFRSAAVSARDAGMDGVELDAGPRSLLRQFHSGLTNLRDDGYGVDRLRLTREVIEAVRGELGPDRVLSLRLSCDELAPWAGITPEIAARHARELAESLDLLVVVRGGPMSVEAYRPDAHTAPVFNVKLCSSVRAAVAGAVPVVLQGSVIEAGQAERALADGVADVVEMTRAQIAEPDLVVKARRGGEARKQAEAPPRPCLLCNQTCQVRDPRNPIITCVGNPSAGHESVDPDEALPAPDPGDVLVVGGGPAGLEAARMLALRGHRVTLAERGSRLGGMLRVAAVGAGRDPLAAMVDWLETECRRLGVHVETGRAITAGEIDAARSAGRVVILATGSLPRPWPGDRHASVEIVSPPEVLAGKPLRDGPILVFDPVGDQVAVAVAEWLAARGREVSIATPDQVVGVQLGRTGDLSAANARLQRAGIARHLSMTVRSIAADGVQLENVHTGERRLQAAATLIDCTHRLPEESLVRESPASVRIGDCLAPRTAAEAIREGRAAAAVAFARDVRR
ncbi:mycofactocin system FadH/OYE family oxidoreductase 1 [Rhodococcus oryzae]|uniref:Mycofactocin system FadH/OYE family oxidoreductase 1 n=1 Tax=Rhodococcus oryzae TaxID=2571143 RepID=A0ABY2RN05_9NOCA|nr:mycofactocin system FadH/OYE family oxidoreductase 1 [Rhodococcus oryzae]TJZ79680.1 mycofactocin system FadH/OYE family oxidoreductase 1 [Rhodococcus oryzae]